MVDLEHLQRDLQKGVSFGLKQGHGTLIVRLADLKALLEIATAAKDVFLNHGPDPLGGDNSSSAWDSLAAALSEVE